MNIFSQLKDDSYWKEVNADKTENDLHDELISHVDQAIASIPDDKLEKLW